MEPRLEKQFSPLEFKLRRARLRKRKAVCWLVIAGLELALFIIRGFTGWNTRPMWWMVLIGGLITAWLITRWERKRPANWREMADIISNENPESRHLLSTALEQQPDAQTGQFSFLQLRVIDQVILHPQRILWERIFNRLLARAQTFNLLSVVALLFVLTLGTGLPKWGIPFRTRMSGEIAVTPGDVEIERGTGLVISARFGKQLPAEATLVVVSASGKTQRIPLERHLADPVFGASLMEIEDSGLYRVEYGSKQTRDFKIKVFDFPALTRADADLKFPGYTGLTNQTIRDTHRLTAVEGTLLDYTLQLNKPVKRARLIGREQTLPLGVQTNGVALLNRFTLTNSARYSLELVDYEGRTNKTSAEFSILVLPNRPPEVKMVFPRGDPRVSRLEEVQLQSEAKDDFGILKYGLGYGVAGAEPQFLELGQKVAANEKRQFTNMIALEKLGVEVDQVVSYFAWADDYGPDGQVRRTFSDMFFAAVRPFEEIFRRDQSGSGESQNESQPGGQSGSPSTRLAELQKQIVIATWKLQRNKPGTTAPSK